MLDLKNKIIIFWYCFIRFFSVFCRVLGSDYKYINVKYISEKGMSCLFFLGKFKLDGGLKIDLRKRYDNKK